MRKILSPGDCVEGRMRCLRVLLFVDACTGYSTALYHLQLLFDDRCYQKYGYSNLLTGSCMYIYIYILYIYIYKVYIYSRILSAGRGNLLKYPVFVNSAYAIEVHLPTVALHVSLTNH